MCVIELVFEDFFILIKNHEAYILFTGEQHHATDSTKTIKNCHTSFQYVGSLVV